MASLNTTGTQPMGAAGSEIEPPPQICAVGSYSPHKGDTQKGDSASVARWMARGARWMLRAAAVLMLMGAAALVMGCGGGDSTEQLRGTEPVDCNAHPEKCT